ncbi:MAG TPA: hypothetical protein ENJ35_04190 [Gammaproteobacteria bacterium]|nr:hypothetical protein [Gammaproteobacteria bacterium]
MGIGENTGENIGEHTGSGGLIYRPPVITGSGAIFFLSATSLPPGSYLTIYGYNLPNPAIVKIGPSNKQQTVINQAYDYDHLPLSPSLMYLGKITGVYNVNLIVDVNGIPINPEKIQKIDVLLDNVTTADTGSLTVEGVGLVVDERGEYSFTDTVAPFGVHSGNVYYVDEDQVANGTGSFASPFNSLTALRNTMAPGDAGYIRETTSSMSTTVSSQNGKPGFLYLTAAQTGTASQPITYSAYPGEIPTWDGDNADHFVAPAINGTVEYVTVHGISYVRPTNFAVGSTFCSTAESNPNPDYNYLRLVGNYAFGVFAGQSGAFITISGHGSAFGANSRHGVRIIGNYCDLTQEGNPTDNNPHVYYFAGRRFTEDCSMLFNRNTRHGAARVIQLFGHSLPEEATDLYIRFNNLEGSRNTSHNSSAQDLVVSHSDSYGGPDGGRMWQNIFLDWNTLSGGGTGIRVWAIDITADNCVAQVTYNVCYDNTFGDIDIEEYLTANVAYNVTEQAISFLKEPPNGVTTISTGNLSGATNGYPGALQ